MADDNKQLTLFTTRVRQMILHYKQVRKENDDLYVMVDERDKEIERLRLQLDQARKDYDSLKIARMLEVTDGDMDVAKRRLSGLIRDVNKCITLLSEK